MKRETAEKWMLLEDAGELGTVRRWLLHRALARQPEWQAWRDDVTRLRSEVQQSMDPVPATPRDVLAAILQAGEQERRAASHSPLLLRPAWAAAAAVVLGIATWMTMIIPASIRHRQGEQGPGSIAASPLSWEDGLDTQLADLYARLDSGRDSNTELAGAADELDAMASELLDEGHI